MFLKNPFSFIILLSFLYFFTITHAQRSRSQAQPRPKGIEPAVSPDLDVQSEENNDLFLVPGVTESIKIHLKGETEDIVFIFEFSEDQTSLLYKVSTYLNYQLASSNYYNFAQSEVLSVNLDYQAYQCSIIGDNGFVVSNPINDNSYEVTTNQLRSGTQNQTQLNESGFKDNSNMFAILEITGGVCGLAVLGFAILFLIKNRSRKEFDEILPDKSEKKNYKINKLDPETIYTSRDLIQATQETCQTCAEAESPLEVAKKILDIKEKPEVSSIQSILSMATTQHSYKTSTMSNLKLLTEENLCAEDDTMSKEIENNSKISSLQALTPIHAFQNPFKSDIQEELALEMDFEIKQERRMPTVKEIRDMARRMEEEGLVGSECNLSDESDDEDQYEAPPLPNYFCCMICFQGTRCTIVDPCRHIFACKNCVEELLDSYQICVLCAKNITGYEPLHPEKEIENE